MDFLNYRGLKYYHELLKEKLKNLKAEAIKESTYFPGDNITIADHVISAVIPQYEAGDNIVIEDGVITAVIPKEHDFTYTASSAKSRSDNLLYFTTDTHEIYRNGISYGGSITVNTSNETASDEVGIRELKDVVTNEKFYPQTHIDAISGIDIYAEKTYVEETYATKEESVPITEYEADTKAIAGTFNLILNKISWQDE